MVKEAVLMTLIAVMTTFQILDCSSVSPLAEDSNGNIIPDLVELQKGTFVSYMVYPMTTYATVVSITIIFTATLITVRAITSESLEYKNNFDIFAKIFKSKMRGWWNVRLFYIFYVLAVLLCVFASVVSAQKGYNPFAEDQDGDGLPSVIEEQVGTDPLDATDVAYLEGINYEDLNESVEWVNVSRGVIADLI